MIKAPRARTGGVTLGAAALLGLAAALGGCSGGSDEQSEAGEQNTRELSAGTLLTHSAVTGPAALDGADTTRVQYLSEDAAGEPIVVSGLVSIPTGKAPDGGWPVVSWAHGTTGYADVCAPSAQGSDGLANAGYLNAMNDFVADWTGNGYAVVRTDYEGLGTPGGHTYMNGASAANTVTDIVRAARELSSDVGTDWVVMGHSQGGQAALFAAERAPDRAPELTLRGAVSIAPGGVGFEQTPEYFRSAPPGSEAIQPYVSLIVLGAAAAEPAIDADAILSPDAAELMAATRSSCPWGEGGLVAQPIPSERVFAQAADLSSLTEYLAAQDPMRAAPAVPTFLMAGEADTEVALAGVQGLEQKFCAEEATVAFRSYPDLDHVPMIVDAAPRADAAAFIESAFAGNAESGCQS